MNSRTNLITAALAATVLLSPSLVGQSAGPTFSRGDVFVGTMGGQIYWYSPTGSLKKILDSGNAAAASTGMAFDSAGNLYSTNFGVGQIVKFDTHGNKIGTFGSGLGSSPESMVFDASRNAYVGQVDSSTQVLKFDSTGAPLASYPAAVGPRGTDWIDLAADQKTLFYTSEGPSVKRYDVSTRTQLADFAALGGESFALRLLGDGGLLVAHTSSVLRLDSQGNVVQTYTALPSTGFLFALNLDPDGTSFWTSDVFSTQVYKVDIASGRILQSFTASKDGASTVSGLAIFGELTQASPLTLTGTCPVPSGTATVQYAGFTVTASGGTPPYTYATTLPPGLTFNATTGAVSGTPTTSGSYPVAITVTDAAQKSQTFNNCGNNVVISGVNAPPLTVTGPCPAPPGSIGLPYMGLTLAVSGGTPPYTFSTILPPGLTFNTSTLTVAGNPTSSGAFPISIAVTDSGVGSAQQTKTYNNCGNLLPIALVAPLVASGVCPLPSGTQNFPYPGFTIYINGGTPPYTFTSSLPPGLTLNFPTVPITPPGTGVVSGVPTAGGIFNATVTFMDSGAGSQRQTANYSCPLTIVQPAVHIAPQSCPAISAPIGKPFTFNFAATGGVGNYYFAVAIGSLPPGLSIRSDTGLVYGNPTGPPGNYPFTISVYSGDQFDQVSCSITVTQPELQLTSGCPTNGTQGVPYPPFLLTATGGSSPSYTFSTLGNLPDGLAINVNTIVGTPTKAGTYTFTPQVTSGTQTVSASRACTVTIAPPPLTLTGTSACPADTPVNRPIAATFVAAGGVPPYSFSLAGPAFLTQSGGVVSGLASASDVNTTASFTITVTDAAKIMQSTTCSFKLTAPASSPAITSSCPAPATRPQNSTFTLPLAATGGTAPYTYSYNGGDPDLALTSTTDPTALTGTLNQQGTFTLTVGVKDASGVTGTPLSCPLTVGPPLPPALTITAATACPTGPLDFGSKFSLAFTANGGVPPYNWSVSPNDVFTPATATGPAYSVSGTLIRSGSIPLAVTLTDSLGTTMTFSCTLTVNPLVPPTTMLNLGTVPTDPTQPVTLTGSIAAPLPVAATGTITLTFTSAAAVPSANNPAATFSTGGTVFNFTLPAGTTALPTLMIQRGKEAGTIHVAVTSLMAAGQNFPLPAGVDIVIPKSPPAFTTDTVQFNNTSTGFDILISGSSSTRDITGGTITFNAANGAKIDGGTVDLAALGIAKTFADFYSNPSRSNNLTDFTNLRIPISISGDTSSIASVTITLTNSAGSTTVTKQR